MFELIYYPKCSTCVKGLALLNENGIEPKLIKYFDEKLSKEDIANIAKKVGSVRSIIRDKTAKELGISLDVSDDELIEHLANEPKLLQRPILIKGEEAIVGRPIEEMLKLK